MRFVIEYWDNFDDDKIDEAFSNFLPISLKSWKCSFEDKIHFLESFLEKLENDIIALEIQIQSHNSQYQNWSFEILFQSSQEEVVLPSIVKIEECFIFWNEFDNSQLKSWFDIGNGSKKLNHYYPVIQYLEGHHIYHHFSDPIVYDMEVFFSLIFQPFFRYGDILHHEFPLPYNIWHVNL